MASAKRIAPVDEARFFEGLRFAESFFRQVSHVHLALAKLTRLLDEASIPHAIVGAMALNEYGHRRVTETIDVLMTAEGLAAFKRTWLGRGYVEKVEGHRGMRDTEHNVPIDVFIAGQYPGDGKPKPVAFPDPGIAERGERVALLPLAKLIELELASGISAPHRLRDLADVLEIIRVRALPAGFGDQLDASVREKFAELWRAAQARDPE